MPELTHEARVRWTCRIDGVDRALYLLRTLPVEQAIEKLEAYRTTCAAVLKRTPPRRSRQLPGSVQP
jgi:hypothetical protein